MPCPDCEHCQAVEAQETFTLKDIGVSLEEGQDRMRLGMERALSAAPSEWKTKFRDELILLAREDEFRFTADDIFEKAGLPKGKIADRGNNAVGAMFAVASQQGIIVKVGHRQAERSHLHATELTVWVGTPHAHEVRTSDEAHTLFSD